MNKLRDVQIICYNDRSGHIYYSGIRLIVGTDTVSANEMIINDDGKMEINGFEGKEDFLDLMSKLYDMAEVK